MSRSDLVKRYAPASLDTWIIPFIGEPGNLTVSGSKPVLRHFLSLFQLGKKYQHTPDGIKYLQTYDGPGSRL